MYRNNSLFDSRDYEGPFLSNGFLRDEPSSERSSLSRPSAKAIYKQRKEYAESITRQPDNFQFRVEHLFTSELDNREVHTVDDCISQLKQLDAQGRVWGQDMLLEVQGSSLQLTDIETKEELESFPLRAIVEVKAVLHSCVYDSILTITVQERNKSRTSVFLFQCEEMGAEHVRADLDKAINQRREETGNQDNIRDNLENIIGQQGPRQQRNKPPPLLPPMDRWSGPEPHSSQWTTPDYEEDNHSQQFTPQEEPQYMPEEPPDLQKAELERNVEILNHVLNDVELFIGQVGAVVAQTPGKEKEKKSKKNKSKKNAPVQGLPSTGEFVSCMQKIKYGFNLLGKLNGKIHNPSAPDFVHILFSALGFLTSNCPWRDLPPSVLTPLLTPPAIQLLRQEVSPEEDQLWCSLGDAWNVPRSQWPDGNNIPPYIPEFSDGWQPPTPVIPPTANHASMRREGRRDVPERENMFTPEQNPDPWSSPQTRSNENPRYMRVMYDFMARNNQELSIMKGDIVQVLDDSRQWWRVRNIREEEGFVPHNVLESMEENPQAEYQDVLNPPSLNKTSKPQEVKAWLEYKGFSKITVRCLGVLSGSLLLGMTRDELKSVCPEEGGRVFFQLQAVKSSLALASESGQDPYYR
ncbi:epidermal growth factor receptor kinase substrate 8-like protein 3b [Lepisosteus oculatus]|uniref:epidermal growth factor receptor kinase substrate 8-like protein 3b n=1 Tax=Lepisosteus oculatus TaxID=7918 RepID=UPI003712D701